MGPRRTRPRALAAAALAFGLGATTTRPVRADDATLELESTAPPSAQKVVAFAAGGVGLAGIAGGAVFGLLANGSWRSARKECPRPQDCPDHRGAVADHDSAELWATTSTVAFAAGGALVATAIVLLLTAPSERAARPAWIPSAVTPAIGAGEAGVVVTGTF
jgi:hypothetical protein